MVLLGRLQGTETQAMRSLSEAVLYTVRTTLLSVIGNDTAEQLLIQLRAAWLMTKQLPSCIRPLFTGERLSSLECGVWEAFIVDELRIIDKQHKAQEQS